MKSISAQIAAAILLATALAGCASDETTNSDTFGQLEVNLIVGNTDVKAVSFDLVCDGGFTLTGQFNVNDEQDPPVWSVIMDVPVGDCSLTLTAFDDQDVPLCIGGPEDFTVVEGETVKVNIVLACEGDGSDPLGNVEVDATFEEVPANNCPRLHLLNAVPDEVPAEGTAVSVLVSDKDDDVLTTALTATGGSFADPASQSTTYTCDDATGTQTMFVTVSDGETACDKSTSFDVTCPGDNLCEDVVCEDDGNVCTDNTCNPATGECESTNNTNECVAGGGELTVNGGFEQGLGLPGWTQFCTETNGVCEATMEEAESGLWSGNLVVQGGIGDAVIKNANIGIGTVTPNSPVTVSVDIKGNTMDGGVVFVQFFSELSGGGVSKEEFVANAVQATDTWTNYTLETTTGPDVGGGVTLQLKSTCGAAATCVADVYFDNASVIFGDGGGAGTCSEGMCVPNADCSVPGDCPDDDNECTDATCDAGTCGTSNNTNVCDGGNGTCSAGVCVPDSDCSVAGDCPDDDNECTDAVCDAGACGTSNNTNVCDGGNGTCSAGVCEPNAEVVYEQDFNQLPIDGEFIGDGWLFFVNVAATVPYGYGGLAPNGPQICALVDDQGGPDQEPQQLSVYSDYNNADHGNGFLIETNVFQEPFGFNDRIPASEVGKTYTFLFQAKAGNIGGSTTANAFIKVLNPDAGFAETDADRQDTTMLSADWGGYSVSLTIEASWVGQILQYGFTTNATNFDPSGNFYDNVVLTTE